MSIRQWVKWVRSERGMTMIYVLLMAQMLSVLTAGMMLFVAAEATGGVRQLKETRVYAVAEGGLHYGIAKLQAGGAGSYAGEVVTIADGGTTLGTATITVTCLEGEALPCSTSVNYPGYRRVRSDGTLPGGGASRSLIAVVQGSPVSAPGPASCAASEVEVKASTIYGDVSSNGVIVLSSGGRIRNDPPPGLFNGYNGDAKASGSITCPQGCATQVAGTTTANMGGTVCPMPVLPAFNPSTTNRTIAAGSSWTMNDSTGWQWQDITLTGTSGSGACSAYTDLRIQTGAAGTTKVVHVRKLTMGRCGRLIIDGDGAVELRVSFTGQPAGLTIGQNAQLGIIAPPGFGVEPYRAPAGLLTVYAQGSDTVVQVTGGGAQLSGIFKLTNGELEVIATSPVTIYGSVAASLVDLGNVSTFYYEPPDGGGGGGGMYTNFSKMRSWKDQ